LHIFKKRAQESAEPEKKNQLRSSERLVTDATPLESPEPRSFTYLQGRGETKNILQTNNTNQRSKLPPTTEPTA